MKTLPLMGLLILAVCCKPNQKENGDEVAQAQVETKTEKVVVKEEPALAPNIKLTEVSLKCRGNGTIAANAYGSGVTIYFTITNNAPVGIKRVFLNGNFKHQGRSLSHSEDFNYAFRKGLEPGETQEVAVRPSPLSKWNDNIKVGDKGDFTLEVLAVEDYDGKKR